uniref:Nitrogen permease regulator 2-like protein n=1 Tax=Phlebotomus papatasi TaxID=29031 RepID=A0A1B0D8Y3_PHLPP
MESHGNAVQCIFLCEFHTIAGPRITIQVPSDYVSKDVFQTVSRYIIPKVQQLQRTFICLNAFHFNVCFVFASTTRTVAFEPVVRKLTEYLIDLELSSKLLSHVADGDLFSCLQNLLTRVRNDINSNGVCLLQEGSTTIPLCVTAPECGEAAAGVVVGPHHAPIILPAFHTYARDQWDLTTLRLLPYITGFNHISRISALADVALDLVRECIRHLVALGVALLVPLFQYSNMYRPTPKLAKLAKCLALQKRCVAQCSKLPARCDVRDVFRMFASMAHGATYGEICVRFNPAALNINDRQMVLFGLVEGLIRTVHRYPVSIRRETLSEEGRSSRPLPRALPSAHTGSHRPTLPFTGFKCTHEICCSAGISSHQLHAILERDQACVVLYR